MKFETTFSWSLCLCHLHPMTLSKTLYQEKSMSLLYNHVSARISALDLKMVRSIPPGGNWQNIPLNIAKQSKRVMNIRKSGGRTTYYGRLRSDLPSYTINTYFNRPGNGTFIHPKQDRLISFREAARLQSFPDSYFFLGSNSSIYKQIGNAVPPLLARAIGALFSRSKVVDVFSGAGGLSKGLEDSNHRVIISADNNPNMRETYAFNHPSTHVVDVNFVNPPEIESFIEFVDGELKGRALGILAGGPPCQGFSTAGKWNIIDPRNQLVFTMLRIVKHLQPEQVVIENVVGMRIHKNGKTIPAIQENLRSLGYESEWFQLNAVQYGVPQRRRRVFIVASLSGKLKGPPIPNFSGLKLKQRNSQVCFTSPELARPITVDEAIGDLPEIPSGGGDHAIQYNPEWISSKYQQYVRGIATFDEFVRHQSG